MAAMIKYNLDFKDTVYLIYRGKDVYMGYFLADEYKIPKTLIASFVDKVYVHVGDVVVSAVHAKDDSCSFFFHVNKIEIYPEFNYAKVYCLEKNKRRIK